MSSIRGQGWSVSLHSFGSPVAALVGCWRGRSRVHAAIVDPWQVSLHHQDRVSPVLSWREIGALQREDVPLPGDLALRKAVRTGRRLDHLHWQQEVLAIADKWRPYRSLATSCLFSAGFEPAGPTQVSPPET